MITAPDDNSKRALEALKAVLEKKKFLLSQAFVELGPDALRNYLNLSSEQEWKSVFDYLLQQGVLRQCILKYLPFFMDLFMAKGPLALRRVFRIESGEYDPVFQEIVDLVGISHGALYAYVESNRDEFARRISSGSVKTLRRELGLDARRYDVTWSEVLDMLVAAVCDRATEDRTYDEGLRAFSMLMNGLRTHRSIRSFGKMWEYAEKSV